jgi:endo-1,4-beta-xylanase
MAVQELLRRLRQLKGKVSAVTFWGMADDDTWLDSFPVVRTDYPLPFDHGLQAKPAYWGVVDETKLPGYGMKFSAAIAAGTSNTRTVTITATNGVVGPAYATQITGFSLKQDSGPPCTPKVTPPGAFPISLGDIAPGASASATFTISLVGCNPNAEFVLRAPWSSVTYDTGTFAIETNFRRDH